MAVTQHLARLTAAALRECEQSVAAVDRLCSPKLHAPGDHLDLDWSPALFARAAECSELPDSVVAAIRRSTAGGREINPAYRDAPDSIWEHPATALSPSEVAVIAAELDALPSDRLLTGISKAPAEAAEQLHTEVDDPRAYVAENFEAMRAFYAGAARAQLAVAMWWD